MNRTEQISQFNPNSLGLKNGNFIGLPFNENTATVVLLPVPWDVTVSYGEGTARGPQAILDASVQLDLYDPDIKDAWKIGIFMEQCDVNVLKQNDELRGKASSYINFIEHGGEVERNKLMQNLLADINKGSEELNKWVYEKTKRLLEKGKIIGIVGGEHSVPLGYLWALSEKYEEFGILHFDAHHDLRKSYEGFNFSHASVFYNALDINAISKLIQVGVRDFCEEEVEIVKREGKRISVFYDFQLKNNQFCGISWREQCEKIIDLLPEKIYISLDVDGLDPKLCPNTGTPVPGGLDYHEVVFLLKMIIDKGHTIIGFDVCETGNNEWDANVAARLIYKLSNFAGYAIL